MLARMQVLHSDHLGSIVAVSDANGQIEARMAFDAWGQRRDPWSDAAWLQWTDLRPVWADAMLAITPRGFTGHEHLDRHGLIHMNGRVYDPRLGRFLQADPFIEDTSTLNRYTYVLNNPLSYSDPSGYFSFKDFARLAFSVTLSFYTQTWVVELAKLSNYAGAIGVAAASGAVAGGVNSGTWDGALSGAFTAVASFGIGQGLEAGRFAGNFAGELNPAGFALKIGAHGVVGGVAAELQGGKFGHGFLSSGVTAAFSPAIHNPDGNTLMQTALAAMIGGTVSEISGGSFANGALTAAMQFALNQAVDHKLRQIRSGTTLEAREMIQPGESLIDFLDRVGRGMRLAANADGIERCATLCGDGAGNFELPVENSGSHMGCADSADSCSAGMSRTGIGLHVHGNDRAYRANRQDKLFLELQGRPIHDRMRIYGQDPNALSTTDLTNSRFDFLYTRDRGLIHEQTPD